MKAGEADLIQRAARGDRGAFDALLEPRWGQIYRVALRIVGHREEAEDVAQSASLRLWNTLGRFRTGEDLDGWIYRMVVNLSIDALRRRRARPAPVPAGRTEDTPAPELRDGAPDPEQRILVRELESALERITADLPPRQKAVFVLTRIEGFSASETARILGVAPSTVRNHLLQVRTQLARRLGERFPGILGGEAGDDR